MGTVALTCNTKRCGVGCPEGENAEFDASLAEGVGAPTSFVRRHPALTKATKEGEGAFERTPTFDESQSNWQESLEDSAGLGPIAPPTYTEVGVPPPPPLSPKTSQGQSAAGVHSFPERSSAAEWAGKQDQFADLPALPGNWIYVRSRSSGEIYFYNTVTGKTTFTRPTDAESDLPAGWTAVKSRTTSQTYYWHAATQKSQFKRPTAAAAAG